MGVCRCLGDFSTEGHPMAFWRSPSEFMVRGILSFLNVFDLLLPLRESGGCGLDSETLRSCLLTPFLNVVL